MTNFRQVTLRLLIWLVLCCTLWSKENASAQTLDASRELLSDDGMLISDELSVQEVPFSWTVDQPPQPEMLLLPEIMQAGLSFPVQNVAPGTSAAEPQSIMPSHGKPAQAKFVSNPVSGSYPSPITIRSMPASMNGAMSTNTSASAISMASSDPAAKPFGVQPTVVLAIRDAAFLLPDRLVTENEVIRGDAMIGNAVSAELPLSPNSMTDARPRILFQPAVPAWDSDGQSILRPAVHLADDPGAQILPTPGDILLSEIKSMASSLDDGRVLIPGNFEPDRVWVPSELSQRVETFRERRKKPFLNLFHGAVNAIRSQAGRDVGVGVERLPFALFEIDAAQPSNNFRLRFESATDWEFADRVEYFWSRIGRKGPKLDAATINEPSVDYQDIRLSFEVGGNRFSATTELPLRFIDPTIVGNTGGMGDMAITTKTVMLDGDTLQLTQVLRTQMPTGSSKRGLGSGHVAMEPGFVARYKWSERTLIHSELKLWFPIGAEPGFSGPVLRYGFGFANVLYDSDTFAVIPTFEFVGWSILSGQKTNEIGLPQSIDGENIINLYPGVRLVRDSDSELGLFELGLSGGASVTERHWYRSVLRLDLRWTF